MFLLLFMKAGFSLQTFFVPIQVLSKTKHALLKLTKARHVLEFF